MTGYSYDNNILYLCCLIEFIGRKQLTRRNTVVNKIGYEGLKHIYDFAGILHSDNIEAVADEYIKKYRIRKSTYDNVGSGKYKIPFYGDIGYVYMSLIASQKGDIIANLISVYNSWLAEKINDYNAVVYFKSPEYLYIAYEDGELPD
ncbi:MAG TPA: hypothetical protein DCP90_06510 [Clostridiales bacterium]|nr:MAG: hypothetical protein A2Y22_00765 [Clostridiales bacterium GWD2_32_59]HAN10245.1 hypothetical protein [Clostridiales bacterium]